MPPRKKRKDKWEWNPELEFLKKNIDIGEGLQGLAVNIGTAMMRMEDTLRNENKISCEVASHILNLTNMSFPTTVLEEITSKLQNLKIPEYLQNMKNALGERYFPHPNKKALLVITTNVNSMFHGKLRPQRNSLKLTVNLKPSNIMLGWLKENIMSNPTLFSRLMRALYFRRNTIDLCRSNGQKMPAHVIATILIDIFFRQPVSINKMKTHMNTVFFLVVFQWPYIKEWFGYLEKVFIKELTLGIFLADLKIPALELFDEAERIQHLEDHPKYDELEEGLEFTENAQYQCISNALTEIKLCQGDNENVPIQEYLIKESDFNRVKEEHQTRYTFLQVPKTTNCDTKKTKISKNIPEKSTKKAKLDHNNNDSIKLSEASSTIKKKDKKFNIKNFVLRPGTNMNCTADIRRGVSSAHIADSKNQASQEINPNQIVQSKCLNCGAEQVTEFSRIDLPESQNKVSREINSNQIIQSKGLTYSAERASDFSEKDLSELQNQFSREIDINKYFNGKSLSGNGLGITDFSGVEKQASDLPPAQHSKNHSVEERESNHNDNGDVLSLHPHVNIEKEASESLPASPSENKFLNKTNFSQDYFDKVLSGQVNAVTENIEKEVSSATPIIENYNKSLQKNEYSQNSRQQDNVPKHSSFQNESRNVNPDENAGAPIGESAIGAVKLIDASSSTSQMDELIQKLREQAHNGTLMDLYRR